MGTNPYGRDHFPTTFTTLTYGGKDPKTKTVQTTISFTKVEPTGMHSQNGRTLIESVLVSLPGIHNVKHRHTQRLDMNTETEQAAGSACLWPAQTLEYQANTPAQHFQSVSSSARCTKAFMQHRISAEKMPLQDKNRSNPSYTLQFTHKELRLL